MSEPAAAMTLEAMQAMLDGSPFIKLLAMKAVSLDRERQQVVIAMPMAADYERHPGTGQFHGGVIASLIDVAGDFALVIRTRGGLPTINFRVDYLRPAIKTSLTTVARVRRAGKSVGVVDVDVYDDRKALVAVGRATYSTLAG